MSATAGFIFGFVTGVSAAVIGSAALLVVIAIVATRRERQRARDAHPAGKSWQAGEQELLQ